MPFENYVVYVGPIEDYQTLAETISLSNCRLIERDGGMVIHVIGQGRALTCFTTPSTVEQSGMHVKCSFYFLYS